MVGSATPPTYSPQGEPRGGSRRAPSPSVWDWGFSDLRRCNNDLEARRDRVLAGLGLLHIRHLRKHKNSGTPLLTANSVCGIVSLEGTGSSHAGNNAASGLPSNDFKETCCC
ncbi:hypothetical protein BDA96_05G172100 [Sorghum bicolor]|uniref:Uncharacterized protein n=2 Tax=Sorghum bicolor TaxID=4558 RepID=A0A921UHU6_SORBI|nr:uncharacterized protein LOC110435485 [Sorghum bicolor]KAG0530276.1 hypothetical protein BDA96_05G172100 [Sorghum bicolor]KXG28721.1 hypothetical protein SORBI_3005G158100 [Sorghum bicolor]|eukprot:XP_021316740.1 uncharacterized protein LOC110435485 [Sorghum bicolor]